jgi:hypothetical protein
MFHFEVRRVIAALEVKFDELTYIIHKFLGKKIANDPEIFGIIEFAKIKNQRKDGWLYDRVYHKTGHFFIHKK